MTDDLLWVCDVCHEDIGDGDGWITIHYAEINAYRDAEASCRAAATAWDTPHPLDHHGFRLVALPELLKLPGLVEWHLWHRACDPDIDSSDYHIDVEQIRTVAELLDWTAHLSEKGWLEDTTWPDVLRGQAERLRQAAIAVPLVVASHEDTAL